MSTLLRGPHQRGRRPRKGPRSRLQASRRAPDPGRGLRSARAAGRAWLGIGGGGRPLRPDIQGLRAVAVLLVALNHARVPFMAGGYVGVDVFFVLSGFLITGLLKSGAVKSGYGSVVGFYARRARRILPAAALTLIVTDVVAWKLLNFIRAKQVLTDSISASLFSANFHFASQGTNYFFQSQPPSPIQHFWSLAVEEQFYLVWPLVLLAVLLGVRSRGAVVAVLRRRGQRHHVTRGGLRRLDVVIVLIIAASLAWSVIDTHDNPARSYFSSFTRAWELGLGAALAIGAERVARLPTLVRAAISWLGLILVGYAAVAFSSSTPFPGYAALAPTVGAVLIVAAGLGEHQSRVSAARLLGIRPLCFIGDRSYAFYLWHWPALIIAMQYEGHALPVRTNLLLLTGAFLLSIVSYALWENPLRQRQWSSPNGALILWPVSILLVVAVAGWGISSFNEQAITASDAGGPMYPGFVASAQAPGTNPTPAAPHQIGLASASAGGHQRSVVASVEAAAQAAQRRAPLPANLTPPVSSLLNAHYTYPGGCAAETGQSRIHICSLGDTNAAKSMVVMGDSHAQMWMPAILAMAYRDGYVVHPVGKSACIPANWWHVTKATSDCSAWYAWAQREIRILHPTITILAGDFGGLSGYDGPAALGIRSLVAALRSSSGHLLVLGDQPAQTQQPVDCLLASDANMGKCSFSPTPAQLQVASTMASATASAGGHFISTAPWFCANNICPVVIGHAIVYVDPGHVTSTYATLLAGVFERAVRQAIAPASL